MSKKKVIAAVALVALVGAAVTVAAQGHRQWRQHGFDHDAFHGRGMRLGMGPRMGDGDGMGDMRGRRGMFGRDLTKDEFDTRLRERFARFDKNGDNVLDATEIEAAVGERGRMGRGGRFARDADSQPGQPGQAGPSGPSPSGPNPSGPNPSGPNPSGPNPSGQVGMSAQPPAQLMLRRLGADKDGKLTRQAFLDRVKARFAEADLDNDGKITDADLPPMMRGRGLITAEGIRNSRNPMFRFLGDVEVKDGTITLDAALAAATKQFERMDRNKDGVVEQADFAAMRKEMTDYQVKRFVHRYGGDKDGKVTREQFFTKESQRFAEGDINGDGVIDRSETGGRPGFGQRMRERFMGPRGPEGAPQGGPPPKQ